MRIEELVLDPFGSFEKRRIAFRLEHRFHLVLGDNEAGKSTTLRALLALLYGMGEFGKDTEMHPKARIEGRFIASSGQRLTVVRAKKGRKDEVLDERGLGIAESVLEDLRGDVDLGTFRASHAMTLAALQLGSKEMLAAKDDIGANLLQARFGKLDVLAASEQLEKEQKEIFTTTRSKKKLLLALDELEKAKSAAEVFGTSPDAVETQTRGLAEAISEIAKLRTEFEEVRTALERARLIVRSAERVEKYRRLSLLAEELGAFELSPEEATRILAAANALQQGEPTRLAKLAEREQADQDLSRLAPPDEILALSDDVNWLRENAEQDRADEVALARLRERQAELDGALLSPAALALAQGKGDLAALLEDANDVVARVQTAATKQGLALKELGDIESEFERVSAEQRALPSARVSASALADLLRALERAQESENAARLAERTQAARLQSRLLMRQRPSAVEEAAFVTFARLLPTATVVDAAYVAIERASERAREIASGRQDQQDELEERRRKKAKAASTRPLPTEGDLKRARAARKAMLADVAANPDVANLEGLARAIDHADALVDELRAHAADVSERAYLDEEMATLAKKIERGLEDERRAKEDLDRQVTSLRSLFPVPIAGEAPESLRAWARWGEEIRPLANALDESSAVAVHHAERRAEASRALREALAVDSAPTRPGTLDENVLNEGRHALERELERAAAEEKRRTQLAALEASRTARTKDVLALESERKAAALKWQTLATTHGLPDDELEGRSLVAAALTAREGVVRRESVADDCRRIEARRTAFQERCGAVARRLSVTGDPRTVLAQLVSRLSAALAADATRRACVRTRERAELELIAQQKTLAWAEEELDNARAQAKLSRTDEVVSLAERTKQKHDLEVELRVLRGELEHLGTVSVEDVARAETDTPRLVSRFDSLGEELQLAERKAASIRVWVERFQEVKDGAAESLALAESHRTDAQDLARQWTVSALAAQMLKDAMTTLRAEAEGPIFQKASAFIEQMTSGRYTRLRVELGNTRAQTIALETSRGETVPLDRLSEGTRDQLFLAVRLAFLVLERENKGPELPLILDDVLTAFDDTRAKATLKLLVGLSDVIEIIYFSHHDRMLELAKSCFPDDDHAPPLDVVRLERSS